MIGANVLLQGTTIGTITDINGSFCLSAPIDPNTDSLIVNGQTIPIQMNANDIIGGNHGTLGGNATFSAGQVGQAFSFNGGSDNVLIGDIDRGQKARVDKRNHHADHDNQHQQP